MKNHINNSSQLRRAWTPLWDLKERLVNLIKQLKELKAGASVMSVPLIIFYYRALQLTGNNSDSYMDDFNKVTQKLFPSYRIIVDSEDENFEQNFNNVKVGLNETYAGPAIYLPKLSSLIYKARKNSEEHSRFLPKLNLRRK